MKFQVYLLVHTSACLYTPTYVCVTKFQGGYTQAMLRLAAAISHWPTGEECSTLASVRRTPS